MAEVKSNPTASSKPFISETLAQYTPRAATYDAGNGGWHAELGADITSWLPAPKGDAVLDLACGTGLVAIPYAEAVGPDGLVVGVDVTEAMLDEAKRKPLPKDSGAVQWVLGDITDLSTIDAVQEVVKYRGGFDVISCCSAFVLLDNAAQVIKSWVPYLKPGSGRVIVDVPTGDRTLMYLLNYPLQSAMGESMVYDFEWVKDIHTMEKIFIDAGLEVEKSFRTRSYLPEKWYSADQALEVLEEKIEKSGLWKTMVENWKKKEREGGIDKVKEIWTGIWKENLNEEGKLWDGHCLYVTIGRRRE